MLRRKQKKTETNRKHLKINGIIYFRRVRYPLRFARPPNLGGQYAGAYCPSVLPTPNPPPVRGLVSSLH